MSSSSDKLKAQPRKEKSLIDSIGDNEEKTCFPSLTQRKLV